jgi:3',5'-cyclic AMP phosphodiesterase CpdA
VDPRAEPFLRGGVSVRKTITACALLLAALICLCPAAAAEESEPLFRFAILSDRTGGHTPGIYPRVIDEINLLNPDFVVTVGDHIEGYGEDYERSEAEWDSLLALIGELEAPVYLTPGNHDIWDAVSESMYVARTGQAPYYSFDHGNTHFVILDVARFEYSSDLPDDQRAWLIEDLRDNIDAGNTFVFYHKPLWVNTLMLGEPDPLHDIFREHGVDAVFNGHLHHYFAAEFDDIEYTVVGSSGGAMLRDAEQPVPRGEFFQFGWVTVTPSGHELAVVDLGGIYPRNVVTTDDLGEIEDIERSLVRIEALRVPDAASPGGPVSVTIENASNRTMDDVITWDAPAGWEVEPPEQAVSIEPGGASTLTFRMKNRGDLFPLPRMSCSYPLSNGRTLDVDLPARVTRSALGRVLARPPAIDGDTTDACWQSCPSVTQLYPGYGDTLEGDTEFTFACDADNLYLSAVCYDSAMVDVVADVAERDGMIFSEDCVGYFLQPDPDSMTVYQIYVSAAGTVFDQKITFDENMWYNADRTWDGEYDVATRRSDDRWSVEIRIPLSQIGGDIEENPTWRANFRRKQARTGTTADWHVPIDYDPGTFGELSFE